MDNDVLDPIRKQQTAKLSRSILWRTLIAVCSFSAIYVALVCIYMSFFSSIIWRIAYAISGNVYIVAEFIQVVCYVLLAVGYVVGIAIIIRGGINHALSCFDLLLGSVIEIVSHDQTQPALPKEMEETAAVLSMVKAEADHNARVAQAAEQRKDELVIYLAHDLKTPLTSIIGYLTLLEESPDLPCEVRARYVGITLEKAYRLESLLSEFFEITRYNIQTIPLSRSVFDGVLFVNQVLDGLYPLAEENDVEFCYVGPDELQVSADASQVARALNNVVKNAVIYAQAQSEIVITTSCVLDENNITWWQMTVQNQGHEIAPEHIEHIFERFYRGDEARRSVGSSGSGLGLAIAKEIVQAHGGDICAASEAGLTTFTLWIPQEVLKDSQAH